MNHPIRFTLLLSLFAGASLILAGCGSKSEDSSTQENDQSEQTSVESAPELNWNVPEGQNHKPPRPDTDATLNLSYGSDPNTLNPLIANDTTSSEHLHYWTVESFASRDYRNPEKWSPRLATDWKISDDGLRYVIHLREGVQFHPVTTPDGKRIEPGEMTAYDVRFTYQAATNPEVEAGHIRNYWGMIDEVTVKDEYTVEIVWGEKYFNAKAVTLGMTVIPERVYGYDADGNVISHDYSSSEFAKGFNTHWANGNVISGTGPFRLTEWNRGEGFTMKRFEDYYADDYPTPASYHSRDRSPKVPLFKQIKYDLIEQPQARYRALLNGDIIHAGLTPTLYVNDLKSESQYENGKIKELIFDYPAYRYIGWNMRKQLFDNKTVRKALTHAVPREEIIEQVFHGYARVQTGPFFYKYPSYNDDVKPYEYNLDRARTLLDKAGWDQKTDAGVRYKTIDGKRVEFSFDMLHYADSPEFSQTASIISDRLKQIGIQMSPDPIKWNEFLETIQSRKFDACIIGWAMGYVSDPYQVWHSSQAGAGAGSNHVGWVHDPTDELVEQIRVTMDPEKRRGLYHEFHKLLHEHQPYTFLWTQKAITAHYSYLHSVGETAPSELPVSSIRPNLDRMKWYIPADR
jgi:ABC-type transport system substrate-binding protein